MHSSNQSRFPLWLLCLLLFVVLVIFFLIRIPILLSSGDSADISVPDVPETQSVQSQNEQLLDPVDDVAVSADEALIVEAPVAETGLDIVPEATPDPTPAPDPTPTPDPEPQPEPEPISVEPTNGHEIADQRY